MALFARDLITRYFAFFSIIKMDGCTDDIFEAAGQTLPAALILSSMQHMLLVLSLGMAMPVSNARAAGLDLSLSSSLLAAVLMLMYKMMYKRESFL